MTLPGYTVFNADDARLAARRMLDRGPVRVKQPLGASGRGQTLVTTVDQLERFLEQFDADEMATYGLVLEENLREVRTLSVGHIAFDSLTIAYYGTQRRVQDNDGRAIYGDSDLDCLRGGWEALKALALTPESRAAVAQAKFYDQSMSEYPGFMASRRNYDVPRASIRMVGADPGCSSRHGARVVRAALNSPRSQNSRRIPRCRL